MAWSDFPKPARITIALFGGVGIVATTAIGAYAGVGAAVEKAADAAVERKWTETYQERALAACTAAAQAGAYKATSEVMRERLDPLEKSVASHFAAQEEHEKSDERRFSAIEKRVGLR